MILKLAKAQAGATKIQCAILSRSGACQLNMSPASGFDCPFRIEPRESVISAKKCIDAIDWECVQIYRRFFFATEQIGSRVKCPTLTHRIVCRTRKLWGTFEVAAFWLSISDRTIAIINTALGAIMRSSYRLQNLENLAEI